MDDNFFMKEIHQCEHFNLLFTLTRTRGEIAPRSSRLVETDTVPTSDEPYTFIDVYKEKEL